MKRTHPIRLLAGSVLLAGLATPSHARIFDQDDRQYARPAEGSLYSPVGLVRQGSTWSVWRAFTTGFLIDDCHVLTSQAVLGYGQAPFGKRLKFETAIGFACKSRMRFATSLSLTWRWTASCAAATSFN